MHRRGFNLQHLEAQHLLTLRLKPQHGARLKVAHASDTALPAAVRKPVLPHLHIWGTLLLLQLPLSGLAVAWLFTEVSACSMLAANTLQSLDMLVLRTMIREKSAAEITNSCYVEFTEHAVP